jgi:TonB family protein
MTGHFNIKKLPPFETALLLSLLVHVGLWQAFTLKNLWRSKEPSSIEIDLTRPFRLTQDPRLARRAEHPGTGAPVVAKPSPAPLAAPPAEVPKDWVLPGPKTQVLEKPSDGEAGGLGGRGDGTGWGEVDWVYLTEIPRLMNREEMARILRRYYPERERQAGNEGDVGLIVHITAEGTVRAVEVSDSAGPDFDEAARKVMAMARFSPAKAGKEKVAVKVRLPISFRLEN